MDGIAPLIFAVLIALMLIWAIFLLNGKGAFLIAGYNTMSKAERARYDKKALCRFTGWLLIVISAGMTLIPVGICFDAAGFIYCGVAVIFASVAVALVYANTGGRFRANSGEDAPNPNNREK